MGVFGLLSDRWVLIFVVFLHIFGFKFINLNLSIAIKIIQKVNNTKTDKNSKSFWSDLNFFLLRILILSIKILVSLFNFLNAFTSSFRYFIMLMCLEFLKLEGNFGWRVDKVLEILKDLNGTALD